jgi:L-asparagine oxygenase
MTTGVAPLTENVTTSLDASETATIAEVARWLCDPTNERIDNQAWVDSARELWNHLPAALRGTILRFRRHSGPRGALLMHGLPVNASMLPPTPTADNSVQRTATIPAAVLAMIACGLGDPAAYRAEKSGALVQDVVPVPGKEDFQGNAGSVLLMFHNENAFHEYRPDFVLLLCLRPDPARVAGLRVAGIREALPLLSQSVREDLRAPEFVTAAPPSFGGDGEPAAHAVLTGEPSDPDIRVDFAATTGLTPAATAALEELQDALVSVAHTLLLEEGDLAIVDNRVTVHGRTAFQPRYDGNDRWLQRTFAIADLRRSRNLRPRDGYVLTK